MIDEDRVRNIIKIEMANAGEQSDIEQFGIHLGLFIIFMCQETWLLVFLRN